MQILNQAGLSNIDMKGQIDWPAIIAALMQSTYKLQAFKYQEAIPSDGSEDFLSITEHFIQGQITSISVFDKDNKQFKIGDPTNGALENIVRAVIHVEHIDIEYTPATDQTAEALTATGLEYDFKSEDQTEAYTAGLEKAKTALNLAYTAKAMGWTKVSFGDTSDPVDRQMLRRACRHVGLDFGEEKMFESSGSYVVNYTPEEWETSASVIEAQNSINSISNIKKEVLDKLNPLEIAANQAFDTFTHHYGAPIGSKKAAPHQNNPVTPNIPPAAQTSNSAITSLGM